MAVFLMGILGLILGISWIKDAKQEKVKENQIMFYVYGFNGFVTISFSILAIFSGIIKIIGI